MSSPRVLLLTPDFPPARGGIQVLLHRIAALTSRLTVRVVTRSHPQATAWDASSGLDVRRTPAVPGSRRAGLGVLNGVALAQARAFRPDAILCGHIVVGPAALLLGRLMGAPVVSYLYADEGPAQARLARLAFRSSAATIAVSRYGRDLAVGLGAPSDRVAVVEPGVDLPAVRRAQRSDEPLIVTVARLTDRYKGHDVMLEALPLIRAQVPAARWVVVGDGPLRSELEARAIELGVIDAVHFVGAVSDAERDAWLDRARVFVMPSRLPPSGAGGEGFGIVYLEAGRTACRSLRAPSPGRWTPLSTMRRACSSTSPIVPRPLPAPSQACCSIRSGRRGSARPEHSARPSSRGRGWCLASRTSCSGCSRAGEGSLSQRHEPDQRRRTLPARPAPRARRGCRADRGLSAWPAVRRSLELGVPVVPVARMSGSLRLHPLHTPRALAGLAFAAARVRRLAARERIDLIHANTLRSCLVAATARRLGAPPFAAFIHDALDDGRAARLTSRAIRSQASVLFANSAFSADRFGLAPDDPRRRVVFNPIDLEAFDPARHERSAARARLSLDPTSSFSLWSHRSRRGRDSARRSRRSRRCCPSIRARGCSSSARRSSSRAPRAMTTVRTSPSCERSSATAGSSRVLWLGDREDVPAILAAVDVLLVPSWAEPFGRVVVEGMAMGCLVAATSVGGPSEVIEDGVDGLLLAPRDPLGGPRDLCGARPPAAMQAIRSAAPAAAKRYGRAPFAAACSTATAARSAKPNPESSVRSRP